MYGVSHFRPWFGIIHTLQVEIPNMWMTQPPSNQNAGPRAPLKIWMPLYHFHLDLAHAVAMVMYTWRALLCEL